MRRRKSWNCELRSNIITQQSHLHSNAVQMMALGDIFWDESSITDKTERNGIAIEHKLPQMRNIFLVLCKEWILGNLRTIVVPQLIKQGLIQKGGTIRVVQKIGSLDVGVTKIRLR